MLVDGRQSLSHKLRGAVICCSGVEEEERARLREAVVALGATFKCDFTSDVTHLVTDAVGSEKYKVAAKLSVPILHTGWIWECYERRRIPDFNAFQAASDYEVKPFTGLLLCATGVDHDTREEIQYLAIQHGGAYSGQLTKSCTHLIANSPDGTKYQYALKWGLRVVNLKWFYDSIVMRACADESLYALAPTKRAEPVESSSRHESNAQIPSHTKAEKQKANVAVDPDMPPLPKQRMKIKIREAKKNSSSEFHVDNFFSDLAGVNEFQHRELPITSRTSDTSRGSSVTAPFRSMLPLGQEVQEEPLRRGCGPSLGSEEANSREMNDLTENSSSTASAKNRPSVSRNAPEQLSAPATPKYVRRSSSAARLFSGMLFKCEGFKPAEEEVVRKEIESQDGRFFDIQSLAPSEYWIVAPFIGWQPRLIPQAHVVTEYWIERCNEDQKIYRAHDNTLFTPLRYQVPLAAFNSLKIGISGYDGLEREHLGKLATTLGAEFTETFSKRNTHLICRPGTDNIKLRKAKEWGIPIASAQWLYACAAEGEVLDVLPFEDVVPGARNLSSVNDRKTLTEVHAAATLDDEFPATNAFQPRFDTTAVLSSLMTPKPELRIQPNASTTATSLEVSFAKNLGRAVEHAKAAQSRSNARDITADQSLISGNSILCDEGQGEFAPPRNLLEGVVLCTSQRVAHRRNEFLQMAMRMGATLHSAYSSSCTHYLHQSNRVNELFKEFKTAKRSGKHIVSPVWLLRCYETGQRVKEVDYPHFYNPQRSLSISTPDSQPMQPIERRMSRAGSDESLASVQELPSVITGSFEESQPLPTKAGDYSASANLGPSSNIPLKSSLLDDSTLKMSTLPPKSGDDGGFASRAPSSSTPPLRSSVVNNFTLNTSTVAPTLEAGPSPSKSADAQADVDASGQDVDRYAQMMDQLLDTKMLRRRPRASLLRTDTGVSSVLSEEAVEGGPVAELSVGDVESCTQTQIPRKEEAAAIVYDDPVGRLEKRKLLEQLESNRKRRRLSKGPDPLDSNGRDDLDVIRHDLEREKEWLHPISEDFPPAENTVHKIHSAQAQTRASEGFRDDRDLDGEGQPQSRERRPTRASVAARTATKKFLLSGISRPERNCMGQIIRQLGGAVLDLDYWHPECTHLIVSIPARTEKCLAATAAGVWVLRPTYIDACKQVSRFLDEADFEWVSTSQTPAKDIPLYNAPRRWRLHLQRVNDGGVRRGSFSGWKILLMVEPPKKDGFFRLLKAGGAEVYTNSKMFRNVQPGRLVYVITDHDASELYKNDIVRGIATTGIPFVDPNYAGEYLFNSPPPTPSKWTINILEADSD